MKNDKTKSVLYYMIFWSLPFVSILVVFSALFETLQLALIAEQFMAGLFIAELCMAIWFFSCIAIFKNLEKFSLFSSILAFATFLFFAAYTFCSIFVRGLLGWYISPIVFLFLFLLAIAVTAVVLFTDNWSIGPFIFSIDRYYIAKAATV